MAEKTKTKTELEMTRKKRASKKIMCLRKINEGMTNKKVREKRAEYLGITGECHGKRDASGKIEEVPKGMDEWKKLSGKAMWFL